MPKPPNEAWSELAYASVQPWFAQRLERAGVPVKRGLVKEEVRFKKSDTSVGWTGHDLGSVAEVDDEPGEDAEEHFEPALYDYRVPECLAVLQPNGVVADWAARNWTPEALETMRALTNHSPAVGTGGPRTWNERDELYKENMYKMYEDSQKSERPDDENAWEKDL
jgi:hypothetical protein